MTRKDYILLAKALRYAYVDDRPIASSRIADHEKAVLAAASRIAIELADDNSRFDREHFLAVVRGEKDLNSHPSRKSARKAERGERAAFGEEFEQQFDAPACLEHFSALPCPICSQSQGERDLPSRPSRHR